MPGNSKSDHDLSIVIPAYNEEKRILPTLDSILCYLQNASLQFEIIVVDDGSLDRTVEVARERLKGVEHKVLRNEKNYGKGYSVRKGVLEAKGATILFSDADLSTPISEIEKLQMALGEGYDIAIGSRSIISSEVEIHQSKIRELMGKAFNFIARTLSFREIRDSQCGFKLFTREVAHILFKKQKIIGFCFDAEILYLANKMGYKIKEVGVLWRNSPNSKVRIFQDSFQMFCDLFRIRISHFGEKYR